MWETDENGDVYFDKFLEKFADKVFDRWKSMGVSHSLSVIYFARTIFLERIVVISFPELSAKSSLQEHRGDSLNFQCQDIYKVVIENTSEIDKVIHLKTLKKEFWEFAQTAGWNIPDAECSGMAQAMH